MFVTPVNRYWRTFLEQVEQNTAGQNFERFALAVSLSSQAGQVNSNAIVAGFNREGVRFALEMPVAAEDLPVGVCQQSVQKVMWAA